MQTYHSMKNSGVAWLGDIPYDWRQKQAKYIFTQAKDSVGEDPSKYELLSLTLRGIIPRSQVEGGKNPENYDSYQVVQENDLIMCLFDYDVTPRTVGRATKTGIVTGAYTNLRPLKGVSTRYYNYFFLALDTTKELLHLCTGLRNGISKPTFFSLNLPVPDYEVQTRIADYLDHETTKIDNLITKQERLLELLEEKRRATISNYAALGLDNKVDFKKTNFDYLPAIPSKWKISKIKYVFKMKNSKARDDNPIILRLARDGVKVRDITTNEGQIASDYSNYNPVEPGDVLLNPMDLQSGANCSISLVEGVISPAYVNLRPLGSNSSKYYDYFFKSQYWNRSFFYYGKGISYDNRWTLSRDTILNYHIPQPTIVEQFKIVDKIEYELRSINKLKAKIIKQVELLKERRASLISNVVTGKVKV